MAKVKPNFRQEELKRRLESGPEGMEPQMVEMEVDVDTNDFDGALDDLISKAEAVAAIAPEEKADALQEVVRILNECKAGYHGDEEVEAEEPVEEGANEVPPINLG